jgi:hypothetical protein
VRIKRARRSPTLPAAQAGPSRDASTLDRLGAPVALYVAWGLAGAHPLQKPTPKSSKVPKPLRWVAGAFFHQIWYVGSRQRARRWSPALPGPQLSAVSTSAAQSRRLLREGIDVKFLIAKHRGIWSAGWLCEALGVSRDGFYGWLTRPRGQRSRSDEELGAKVRASFVASDRTYGTRRVWKDMLAEGLSCGLHRIERLMGCRLSKHVRDGGAYRPIWVSGRRPPSLRTCSSAPSTRLLPTANGLLTSRMCGQRRVGSKWLLLSISFPAALSAGR